MLQLNQTITTLRLTHNNIPDEGISALAEMLGAKSHKTITEIDVSGNRLGGKGAKALATLLEDRSCTLRSVSGGSVLQGERGILKEEGCCWIQFE